MNYSGGFLGLGAVFEALNILDLLVAIPKALAQLMHSRETAQGDMEYGSAYGKASLEPLPHP